MFVCTQMPGSTFPLRVAVLGDPGQTFNTVTTLQHIQRSQPDLVLLAGDFSYADEFDTRGDVQPDSDEEALSCEWEGRGLECTPGLFLWHREWVKDWKL
jgi:hypothetical protein